MTKPTIIHLVDPDHPQRMAVFHALAQLGHHAEIYADVEELADYRPAAGVVLLHDDGTGSFQAKLHHLVDHAVWLPVIATGASPSVPQVVAALKAGALDFLALPLSVDTQRDAIRTLIDEAARQSDARRRLIEARARLSKLSARERQVLDRLVEGNSNKAIARALDISPRTVEIHRANMMGKLGARHPADAVRLRLEAGT